MTARRFSVAPMLDWTDRHCRYFHRLISQKAYLYTEMIHCNAIIRGERERLIGFNEAEHPVALQLGGSDPALMAEASMIAEDYGYDEININVGCPSERVQKGSFGACLMADPELIADNVQAIQAKVSIPVTVKTRIGIDDQDAEEFLHEFIRVVHDAGCKVFIIHARKAWLKGLSPKENRDVPPLDYSRVHRLKEVFPACEIHVNGGVNTLEDAKSHLERVDGVMMGRAAYHYPSMLNEVDAMFYGVAEKPLDRNAIMEAYFDYALSLDDAHIKPAYLFKHILGLYSGEPGAKQWRQAMTEAMHGKDASFKRLQKVHLSFYQ